MRRLLIALVVLCHSSHGHATEDSDDPAVRTGLTVGVATGGGLLVGKESGGGTTSYGRMSLLNLKVGYLVSPATELCLTVPSGGHSENGQTRAFEAILLAGRHWFADRLWGLVAAGLAMEMPPFYDVNNDDPQMHFGVATAVGAGYEVLRFGHFAVDLQARYLYGTYRVDGRRRHSSAVDLLAGLNWYRHGKAPN